MKKWFKGVSTFLNRYINGTQGAISLFLAFLLTPILSLSLLLVESARYQSMVQLVEEISDMCGLSTLSNYDSYLQERFGLLSVDQEKQIHDTFKAYLKENTNMLGSAITLKDTSTSSGAYALSNDQVLKQQIMEQSEIIVTAKTVFEGLDLDNLFDDLADKLNLDFMKKLGEQADYLKATAELGDAVAKLVDQIQNLQKSKGKFDTAYQEYRKAWSSTDKDGNSIGFQNDALTFINALKTAASALPADSDPSAVYNDEAVKDAMKDLKDATTNYKSKAEALKSAITTLRSDTIALEATVTSLDEKAQSFLSSESTANGQKTYDTSSGDWIILIVVDALERLEKISLGKLTTQLQDSVDKLSAQILKLKNLDDGNYTAIKTTWTADTLNQEDYDPISVDVSILGGIWSLLNDLVKESTFDLDIMDKLNELVQLLLNIDCTYDHALNAVVSSSSIFQTTTPDSSDQAMIESIQSMANAATTAKEALKGTQPLYKLIFALGDIMKSVGKFLESVVLWANNFIIGILDVATTLFSTYTFERLLICGYCAYNMPNRVNCTTGSALTGYKYLNVFLENGGELGAYNTGSSGGSLFDSLSFGENGSDPAFKGAVQEYILIGSMSEYENQCCAFFRVYMFRLLLNLPVVLTNADLNVFGPLTMVAKILVALAEPMLDTIFLVNGMSESLWKDGLYISVSGLDNLISKLMQLVHGKVSAGHLKNDMKKEEEEQKKENSSGDGSSTGGTNTETGDTGTGNTGTGSTDPGNTGSTDPGNTGTGNTDPGNTGKDPENEKGQMKNTLFSCSYGDHLYLLSFIAYKPDDYLNRLQNVIQSEADHYYTKEKGYSFDLAESYTHIKNTVEYTLNPVFSIDALTKNGLFDVSFSRYNGY